MDNTLRVRRAEKRVTQTALAVALGMTTTRVWRIENGVAEPTKAEQAALAAFFGCSERKLFPRPKRAAVVEVR